MPHSGLEKDQMEQFRIIGNTVNHQKSKYYKIDHNLNNDEFEKLVRLIYDHLDHSKVGKRILSKEDKLIALSRAVLFYLDEILHDHHDENCLKNAYVKKLQIDFNQRVGPLLGIATLGLGIAVVLVTNIPLAFVLAAVVIGEGTIALGIMSNLFARFIAPSVKESQAKQLNLKGLEAKLDHFADTYLQQYASPQ